MILAAHQAQDRLAAGDLGPELGVGGKDVALEIDAADLELGALEDLDHDLVSPTLPPSTRFTSASS